MQKIIYMASGIVIGSFLGFIAFTVYFQPLLSIKKSESDSMKSASLSLAVSDVLGNHSVNSSKFAFQELDYEPAISLIGHEMALSLEAYSLGVRNEAHNLTVAMLGACLAKINNDQKQMVLFEQGAVGICKSWSSMDSCELESLYKFIRKFTEVRKC